VEPKSGPVPGADDDAPNGCVLVDDGAVLPKVVEVAPVPPNGADAGAPNDVDVCGPPPKRAEPELVPDWFGHPGPPVGGAGAVCCELVDPNMPEGCELDDPNILEDPEFVDEMLEPKGKPAVGAAAVDPNDVGFTLAPFAGAEEPAPNNPGALEDAAAGIPKGVDVDAAVLLPNMFPLELVNDPVAWFGTGSVWVLDPNGLRLVVGLAESAAPNTKVELEVEGGCEEPNWNKLEEDGAVN
jgi:hypothetical protein